MGKFTKRVMLLIALLVVVVGVFVIRPLVGTSLEGKEEMDYRLKKVHAGIVKAGEVLAMESDVRKRHERLVKVIGMARSESVEMSAMVSNIEAAAHEAGIHIANMQPQRSVESKGMRFFPVQLEVDGQWTGIVRFVYLAQQQPNYCFIDNMPVYRVADAKNALHGRIVLSRMRIVNP